MHKPPVGDNRKIARLFREQEGLCFYCCRPMRFLLRTEKYKRGESGDYATLDHVVPKSKGGGGGDNIVACCKDCNSEKSSKSHDEFIRLKRKTNDPTIRTNAGDD